MKPCLFLFAIILTCSCTRIYFEQPQPLGAKALTAFPKDIRGAYLADNDTFYIKELEFTYTDLFDRSITQAEINSSSSVTVKDSLIYDKSSLYKTGFKYHITKDTLHYKVMLRVSQVLSDSLVLKAYDRFWVLNEREDNKEVWNTYLIEKFENGDICIWSVGNFKTETNRDGKIKYQAELKDFYKITEFIKIGEDEYLINPTLKEFKMLIKNGFFIKADTFGRISY
ncbi:hypothetical protein LVD17_01805 [Fulvivirga ulvae]|uniref:hypothetical protein n=1 Tax=Fulvivirga ulvae TaxID=2904245 RepID=UPI001F2288E9|nr:hypothetical protein [Fulvivirga ulvae]UII32574.1 hypothetical protein LVD17_01805 [Fulvivirga ulvae]